MNSLNLLSAKVIGTPTTRARSKSQGETLRQKLTEELLRGRAHSSDNIPRLSSNKQDDFNDEGDQVPVIKAELVEDLETPLSEVEDEKQLLLSEGVKKETGFGSRVHSIFKKLADAITAILATIGMPIVYVARCFQDENGKFSALVPLKRKRRKQSKAVSEKPKPTHKTVVGTKLKHSYSSDSLSSINSDSDNDKQRSHIGSLQVQDPGHRRRSSRIRLLQHEDVAQRRKSRLADADPLTVDSIKSPMSAATATKLKYPHAPQPPRPLIPRRQPSYSKINKANHNSHRRTHAHAHQREQKTLILDLDETLIHSFAKGGRMSSGHMVEVKLNAPVLNPVTQVGPGAAQQQIVGPNHPILYYVHKRPFCDEFLRKICKWYKVVIFTASVQEYADPVIDWLEQEKKYFAGRYYRQHCTFRNGAYIKDLSSIEPDLTKVMILDNSPVSYVFHEDNAIPIEGWINDPTDNDLLHLIPLLEALQYVSDVRALLALRRGEAEANTSTAA